MSLRTNIVRLDCDERYEILATAEGRLVVKCHLPDYNLSVCEKCNGIPAFSR